MLHHSIHTITLRFLAVIALTAPTQFAHAYEANDSFSIASDSLTVPTKDSLSVNSENVYHKIHLLSTDFCPGGTHLWWQESVDQLRVEPRSHLRLESLRQQHQPLQPRHRFQGDRLHQRRLLRQHHLDTRLDLNIGASVSHFSNGNTAYPNMGLNTLAAKVGLSYYFNRPSLQSQPTKHITPPFQRHISYDLLFFGA